MKSKRGHRWTSPRGIAGDVAMILARISTGGSAQPSTSIGYYHSAVFEAVAAISMVASAMGQMQSNPQYKGNGMLLG